MNERWIRYYRSDTDTKGVELPDTLFVFAHGVVGEYPSNTFDFKTVTLTDGKPHLYLPHLPAKYFCMARIMLSSFQGTCPPGQWRIGYRDRDKTNVKIENLYWRGDIDEPPASDGDLDTAYDKGVAKAADLITEASFMKETTEYLEGINHTIDAFLQSLKL